MTALRQGPGEKTSEEYTLPSRLAVASEAVPNPTSAASLIYTHKTVQTQKPKSLNSKGPNCRSKDCLQRVPPEKGMAKLRLAERKSYYNNISFTTSTSLIKTRPGIFSALTCAQVWFEATLSECLQASRSTHLD